MSSSVLTPTARPRLAVARTAALRLVYTLLSLWAVAMSAPGPIALLAGKLPDPRWEAAAAVTVAWKLLTVGPAMVVAWSGGRSVLAVRALVVGQACWLAASLLAPEDGSSVPTRLAQAGVSVLIWVGPWLLLAARRSRLWREPLAVDRPLLAVSTVAVVALAAWAVSQTHLDVTGGAPGFDPRELRFDMAGLPLALAGSAVVAATHRARWWTAATAMAWVYVGGVGLLLPHGWGSPGVVIGTALVVGGLLLAGRRMLADTTSNPGRHTS